MRETQPLSANGAVALAQGGDLDLVCFCFDGQRTVEDGSKLHISYSLRDCNEARRINFAKVLMLRATDRF